MGLGFSNQDKIKQDFNNSKRENIKFDNSLNLEEYSKFELKTELKRSIEKIPINIPTMCPICGCIEIEGYFNYKLKNKKYIKIPLCKDYYTKLGQKPSLIDNKIDIILLLSIVLFLFSGILIYILTLNVFTVILIAISIPLFVYIIKKIFEKTRYNINSGKINEYVRLGYSKEYIVISIKNPEWANEFRILNSWKEIPYNSEGIKTHREKGLKWAIILVLWIIISIPVTIISSIYFAIYGKLIVYFFVFIPIFIIGFVFSLRVTKEQALKTFKLSNSQRMLLILIYLILILLITLDFFDVFKIF